MPHISDSHRREYIEDCCKALNRASRCEYALRLVLARTMSKEQVDECVARVRNADFSDFEQKECP